MLLVSTADGGALRLQDNVATGALGGVVIQGGCDGYELFDNNVAMGNGLGFLVYPSDDTCTSLPLIAYRNSVGIGAGASTLSNVFAAENGAGIAPVTDFLLKPR